MQESDSADNPQAKVTETEKGWLAGIIDGEGCLQISYNPKRPYGHPYLTITNSNNLLIEKAADIWHRLGVGCRIQKRDRKNPVKDVQVIGFKRLHKALVAIMPYLVSKQDQALTLYRFVESRLNVDVKHIPNEQRIYSDYERSLIELLKEQKHYNLVLNDYTPNAKKR